MRLLPLTVIISLLIPANPFQQTTRTTLDSSFNVEGSLLQDASVRALNLSAEEVAALVNAAGARTTQMTARLFNYTFMETAIEFELDKNRQVKREQSKVYEVYPLVLGKTSRWVYVQVSENNVPFSAEKIARERERVTKQLTDDLKAASSGAQARTTQSSAYVPKFNTYGIRVEKHSGLSTTYWYISPTDFFRSHDFYQPRRAILRGRVAVLLSFRPRPNYVFDKTNVRFNEGIEDYGRVMSQLGGQVWVDTTDKTIMRLEAVPVQELTDARAFQPDSVNEKSPLVFEFVRLEDGTWVPSLSRYDSTGRENVFWKTTISRLRKYADFKLFKTSVEAGKPELPPDKP